MRIEELVYFHSLLPSTTFQPVWTIPFCRNKIPIGLIRHAETFLHLILVLWNRVPGGRGRCGRLPHCPWSSGSPAEEGSGALVSCWSFSQCQRGRRSPAGRYWPIAGIPPCQGCDPERSGMLPTLLPGTLQYRATGVGDSLIWRKLYLQSTLS